MKLLFLLFIVSALGAQPKPPPTLYPNPEAALQLYRSNLIRLRQEYPNHRDLPDLKFFLFGMGNRTKYIYRNGRLLDAQTGNIEKQWTVRKEVIVPSEYLVHLTLADSSVVQIREDETGVWTLEVPPVKANQIATNPKVRRMNGTKSPLMLPRFADHSFGPILRVLHQEVLINISTGVAGIAQPLPNFLVYQQPQYRNAALMAMVLRETGNLPLIRDWIMSIRDPFDRNKPGVSDADNPGEVLFLASLVADKSHPVVQTVLDSVRQFQKEKYIIGKTDGSEHPVYQTKWLKFGLKSLDLPDPYSIPKAYDSYSSLFWWAYKNKHMDGQKLSNETLVDYPYLVCAEDHFYNEKRGIIGNIDYPLSWAQNGTDANYPGMTVLDKNIVKQKLAFPHSWYAAELFLLLNAQ